MAGEHSGPFVKYQRYSADELSQSFFRSALKIALVDSRVEPSAGDGWGGEGGVSARGNPPR